ncbi:ABC transporter permease [Acuticoccus sp. I52.16.1]|uniref:ABC transporter permease n=1 Tax=Acuticoccus sp. I52.16.1 TaxID=2928472 RepID=UPI001FD032C4|nr:ABC transporter permease [Acuticoccus sp. I52.16.1]UOM35831.1 ABC transporter permease [Acuticoccus sp. I52.16.1]
MSVDPDPSALAVEARAAAPPERPGGAVGRAFDSDLWHSFAKSPVTILAAIVTVAIFASAIAAPWIAPHDPFDLASLSLLDSLTPPVWLNGGNPDYLLGTDDQGRDMLSAILYGTRISLGVGFASVAFAAVLGISLGLLAGYVGGAVDTIIMRVADVQLTFPAILIALLIDGTARGLFPGLSREDSAFYVLTLSIGLSFWVQYARTVRGSTLVEANKEYVMAARLIGLSRFTIMLRHVLPNVLGPVLVIATINLALAIILEATLSFLGVGVPPTEPSLGTLIRVGQDFLFSGEWWITIFPGAMLAILVLAVNLLGDWLRDALNPRLR